MKKLNAAAAVMSAVCTRLRSDIVTGKLDVRAAATESPKADPVAPGSEGATKFKLDRIHTARRGIAEEASPMTDWNTCPAVERDPRKISGAWAFTGTRVPVYALFENLESGATVKEFLEWYPEVGAWQVAAVLKQEAEYFKAPA